MDPTVERTEKNTKSVIYLIIAIALIVAAIAAVVFVFTQYPDVLKNTLYVILVLVAALIVIAVAIWIFSMFLAVGYYARGTTVQTDYAYDIKDVKEVDGKMIEEEKKEE